MIGGFQPKAFQPAYQQQGQVVTQGGHGSAADDDLFGNRRKTRQILKLKRIREEQAQKALQATQKAQETIQAQTRLSTQVEASKAENERASALILSLTASIEALSRKQENAHKANKYARLEAKRQVLLAERAEAVRQVEAAEQARQLAAKAEADRVAAILAADQEAAEALMTVLLNEDWRKPTWH